MTKPLIALSQRRDATGPPHDEIRDALDARLSAFVLQSGAWPLPVPSALNARDAAAWCGRTGVSGILLSGGADPGADPVRDRIEEALMDHARAHDLPLLGVCRGMQVMGTAAGAACVAVAGHVACRHAVTGEIAREVNSYHALALGECPTGYAPLARAEDGTLEAMRHGSLPWEGWMWHPEREHEFDRADMRRFGELFGCVH